MRRIVGVDANMHRAAQDREEGIGVVVDLHHHFTRCRRADVGIEQELAQLQRRESGEQGDVRSDLHDREIDFGQPGDAGELGAQQSFVGRFDIASTDELDDFIPLIDALLDQWIAGQRTDDVEARHIRFVTRRDRGHGGRIIAWKHHATGLDEGPRRQRTEARDDAIAQHLADTILGLDLNAQAFTRRMTGCQRRHRLRAGVVHTLERAVVDSARDVAQIALFGAREFVATIENDDTVAVGQPQRVLDSGVSGADHHDGLLAAGIRIVELILHLRQRIARHFHAA